MRFSRWRYQHVTGLGREAGAALVAHPGIQHISFTGSPATGAWVAQEAAKRHCPVTLELGGKGPQIVFADADLETALPVLVNAIVQNAGQTCSAGSRLLVEQSRYEQVLEQLGRRFRALKVGPALADLDCGPLIRAGQLHRVRGFLADAERDNIVSVACGTIRRQRACVGLLRRARLLRDVPSTSRLACEEVFGPVLAAMPFATKPTRFASPTNTSSVWSPASGQRRWPADADGARDPQRSGIHQQLRARRWRGVAVRRRQIVRLWP
jgi:aldehyde dehydrogenase (NAD+)